MNTHHATLAQLLDIRDGIECSASQHVDGCEHCQAEMASLESINAQLFEAYDGQPSSAVWHKISQNAGLQSRANVSVLPVNTTTQQNSLSRAIYALAASVAFVGIVTVFMVSQQGSSRQQADQLQAGINQLMMNSRGLETVLQQVVVNNDRLNAEDRAAAERLYWKLTYVDEALHESNPDEPDDAERIKILWSDRIDVLNELNTLFYERRDTLRNSEH